MTLQSKASEKEFYKNQVTKRQYKRLDRTSRFVIGSKTKLKAKAIASLELHVFTNIS